MSKPTVLLGDRYWSIAPFIQAFGDSKSQLPWLGEVAQCFASQRPGGYLARVGDDGSLQRRFAASFDLTGEFEDLTWRNRAFATEADARRAYLEWLDDEIRLAQVALAVLATKRNDLAIEWGES